MSIRATDESLTRTSRNITYPLTLSSIEVSAIDIPDTKIDRLGARGIGEIGITGTGAAIANAIYHATGKRVRNLPITPDRLMA